MRPGFLIFSALFLTLEVCAQTIPIFKHKKDSVDYAALEAILGPLIKKALEEQDFEELDSAFRARRKFFEGKEFINRTVFTQDRNFTHYQDLDQITNKDSITRISMLGEGRRKLPRNLYRYKNLADIELINFKLRKVPRRLRVKTVTLYNNFPRKPLKLSKNSTITYLAIRGDEDGMLPKRYDRLRKLEALTLSRNNLKSVPDFEGCTSLRTLSLNNNSIEEIGSGIEKLTNLESLSFYKNNIASIPDFLYKMRSLKVIDLYFNHIKVVSPAVANWKKLEILYLANNDLYSLPDEIGELTNLRELYLHHNKLSNIPVAIGNLTSLNVLRINNNGMIEWPEGLSNIKSLTNLDCSFNNFETLPITELDFRNMKILSIGGNPWDPDIKPNIIAWVDALRENETVVHIDNYLLKK